MDVGSNPTGGAMSEDLMKLQEDLLAARSRLREVEARMERAYLKIPKQTLDRIEFILKNAEYPEDIEEEAKQLTEWLSNMLYYSIPGTGK